MKEKNKNKFSLRRLYRYHDSQLIITAMILLMFGSMMAVSAAVGMTLHSPNVVVKFLFKQSMFIIIGVIMYTIAANVFQIRSFVRYRFDFMMVIAIFVLLLFCLAFAPINGSQAWIPLGGLFSLQPSEFTKIGIMILFSVICYKHYHSRGKQNVMQVAFWYIIVIFMMIVIVAILQDDFGSAIVMGVIFIVSALIPRDESTVWPHRLITGGLLAFFIVTLLFIFTPIVGNAIHHSGFAEYQIARFTTALEPFSDPLGAGYQLINSLLAFASGGLQGLGFGASIQKYGYLPEAHTDYILAIVVEELGLLGLLVVVLCTFYLIHRLTKYALQAKYTYEKVIFIGMATYLFTHFFFNVGGVIGLIPLTGVPLLLVSSGGSSIMAVMCGLGVCQAYIKEINKRTLQKERENIE